MSGAGTERLPVVIASRKAFGGSARARGAIPGSWRGSRGSTSRGRSCRSGSRCFLSFNNGKSQSALAGFLVALVLVSDPVNSVWHDPQLHQAVIQTLRLSVLTTVITVPLGVGFAIGIDRWRSRTSSGLNFVMIFSFVVPELLLAVALMFVFTQLFTFVSLGTTAEVAALVVWNISWPAIIVRARLLGIGKSYEEAAADLGCSRLGAMRRVLLPMLMPAIFASCGAGLRRGDRRLRDRRAVVVVGGHTADVGGDLLRTSTAAWRARR